MDPTTVNTNPNLTQSANLTNIKQSTLKEGFYTHITVSTNIVIHRLAFTNCISNNHLMLVPVTRSSPQAIITKLT